MVNGIINVYKEKGYTSFDVVAKPVSYTHLDVYKRQVLFKDTSERMSAST